MSDETQPKEEQSNDGLSEYIREIEKLRDGSYYYVLGVTIGPDKDGRPVTIPMMIGDGLELAKQQIKIVDDKDGERVAEGTMTVQTAFIQAIGHAVKFGFERLPWEGYDKNAVAMELLSAMRVGTPETGEGQRAADKPRIVKP